jgi:hypothetical protein
VEAGSVAGSARQRRGRHRLVRQWINGVGSGDVRVRVLGCQGGAAPTRLEGAWERRAARDGQGRGARQQRESESETASPDTWQAAAVVAA